MSADKNYYVMISRTEGKREARWLSASRNDAATLRIAEVNDTQPDHVPIGGPGTKPGTTWCVTKWRTRV